jgi:hypothetical protein
MNLVLWWGAGIDSERENGASRKSKEGKAKQLEEEVEEGKKLFRES